MWQSIVSVFQLRMAGTNKLFKVFAIILLLGAVLLIVDASNKKHLKKKTASKKTFKQLLFSDDDDLMLGDEPESSGDGSNVPDNEGSASPTIKSLPSANQIDPDFSIDGLPDINDLLTEEGNNFKWPTFKPPVQPTARPPCHLTNSCPPVKPPCQSGQPCPPAQPPCYGKPCPPVQPPCNTGKPCPPIQPPCHSGKPCPPVQPPAQPPCHSGKPCPQVKPPCQPNRPCHSKLPCHSSNGLCNPLSLPPAYSPTSVCGKTYFCRKGFSGPCNRNEVFTSSPSYLSRPVSSARSKCSNYFSPPPGCFSSTNNPFTLTGKSSPGYCTIRYAQQPCYGYPSTYRYCKQTKHCYPTMSTSLYNPRPSHGPCLADQYFTATDQSYGYCRCSRPNYVHCPKTNRCYPAYTKGSCSTGQWLVPHGNHGLATCKACPCPSLADGQHIYWSGMGQQHGRPGCYKSQTRGPCRHGMRFVISDILTGSAHCVRNHSDKRRPSSSYNSLLSDWNLFYGKF